MVERHCLVCGAPFQARERPNRPRNGLFCSKSCARYKPLEDRLDAMTCYEPNTGCWLWTGGLHTTGYAKIRVHGRRRFAHIVTYELEVGPIPDGKELDHLCRVRHCRSPYHLEPVTHWENSLRGQGACARNARKAHCPQGHPYSPSNTIYERGGRVRRCRICRRAQLARAEIQYRARRRALVLVGLSAIGAKEA